MKSGVTLQQMLTEVKRQSESKEDYLIAPNRLRMESYGKEMFLHLSDNSGTELIEPMTITGIAHRQIGTHLRIPAAYYDRMREERPDLLAYNANTWFKQESSQRMDFLVVEVLAIVHGPNRTSTGSAKIEGQHSCCVTH